MITMNVSDNNTWFHLLLVSVVVILKVSEQESLRPKRPPCVTEVGVASVQLHFCGSTFGKLVAHRASLPSLCSFGEVYVYAFSRRFYPKWLTNEEITLQLTSKLTTSYDSDSDSAELDFFISHCWKTVCSLWCSKSCRLTISEMGFRHDTPWKTPRKPLKPECLKAQRWDPFSFLIQFNSIQLYVYRTKWQ